METLDTVRDASLIRPLLEIWEPVESPQEEIPVEETILSVIKKEEDNWLRACAAFATNPENIENEKALAHLLTVKEEMKAKL